MSRFYYQRHPERTVLYRVLFHYFEQFLHEYENQFERLHGYLRPIVEEVVDKYLDCGNPKCGFARIKCSERKELKPGIIAVIQSFGSRINFHPHLHFLVTEGGADKEGRFHKVSSINDSLLCRFFTREVFLLLLRKQLINRDLVEKILLWQPRKDQNIYETLKSWIKDKGELYSVYAFYSRILKDSYFPADFLLKYVFSLGIIVIVFA